MKRQILIVFALVALASCAPKKYAYHFDHHNYQAGKKAQAEKLQLELAQAEMSVQQQELTVSTDELAANADPSSTLPLAENKVLEKAKSISKKYVDLKASEVDSRQLKSEMKRDLKDLKKDIKKLIKEKSSPSKADSVQALDKNLKYALIFFVAAIIATIFIPILGWILWLIGLIFFILWLVSL